MRIVVFGASGQTGRVLVQGALARQHAVTAFVRDAAKGPGAHAALRTVVGDVADAAAVAAAVQGSDAVVSALGGTPLTHDPAVIAGVQHIVHAMEAHGVRRLIYLSFIGVRESRSAVGVVLRFVAPIPLRNEIADHEAKEAIVKASGLDWTIVRPPKLTNGPRTGTYRSGENISTWKPVPQLSRADLADFMLTELADRRYLRQAPRLLH